MQPRNKPVGSADTSDSAGPMATLRSGPPSTQGTRLAAPSLQRPPNSNGLSLPTQPLVRGTGDANDTLARHTACQPTLRGQVPEPGAGTRPDELQKQQQTMEVQERETGEAGGTSNSMARRASGYGGMPRHRDSGYGYGGMEARNPASDNGGAHGGMGPRSGSMYGGMAPRSGSMYGGMAPRSGSMYGGMASRMGSVYGGVAPRSGSMYGGMAPRSGSMYGGVASRSGSMYGGMAPRSGSMYGGMAPRSGSMYGGMAPRMGSMYGGMPGMGSMYGGMASRSGSMYGGVAPGMGSMYGGMAPRSGSMYGGMAPRSGSMYGGMASRNGSVYGGVAPGSGSMYGGMAPRSGSMYGGMAPRSGSMYGGMAPRSGSMYGGMASRSGSMYGGVAPGSGSMYGGMAPRSGSMYGGMAPRMGSMYGGMLGMDSMYGGMLGMGSMYGGMAPRSGSVYGGVAPGMGSMYGGMSRMGSMYRGMAPRMGSMFGAPLFVGGSGGDAHPSPMRVGEGPCAGGVGTVYARSSGLKNNGDQNCNVAQQARIPSDVSKEVPSANTIPLGTENRRNKVAVVAGVGPEKPDTTRGETKHPTEQPAKVNDNIHALVVVSAGSGAEASLGEGKRSVVVRSRDTAVECEVDEIVQESKLTMDGSRLLRDIIQHVGMGHNAFIILADSGPQQSVAVSAATLVMKAVMANLEKEKERKGSTYEVYVTAADLVTVENAKDHLVPANAADKPVRLGSNPLSGSCLVGLEEKTLSCEGDVEPTLRDALKHCSESKMPTVVQMTLKQIRRGGAAVDVYVSSLMLLLVKDRGDYLRSILDKTGKIVPIPLVRSMLGGSSRVVAIAALSGGDSAAEALILSNTAALREVKNTPPRSGNVSRFIAFTQEQEERCAAAVASAKDAKEKARHGFMLQQLRTVLADARELQDRPEGTKLQVYSSSREPRSGGGARGKVPGTDEPCTTPAAGAPRTVGEQQRELGTVAVAKDAGPWAVPVKIVVTGESGPPGDIIEITVEGEKKLCKVDELIRRSGDGVVECDAAKRLQGVLASGHNAALLSAEMAPELPLERQATWGIMQAVLGGVLGMGKTGATKELTLYMSVLCGDQVVADLIGDPRPRQLVLSKSPLFGVLVHEATATVVKEVAQMENVVCGALKRASGLLKKDEYIVCTAVLKQVSSDDVNVASLLVVNALDMRPYMEALEGSSAPSKALFAHAFTGPCSSVVLISYKEMDSRVSNALVAQRRMEPRSKPRSGSVKQFVSVVEKSIAVAEERLKSGERPGQSLSEMKQAVDDAKELLKAPNDRQPTAYVMPQVRESNVDTTIRVAAIVTERRESKSCCVTGGERSFTVTSAGGAKEFPADEVVRRMGHISSVRSLWVDSLVDRFIEGYNTALLTADSDGVSSGRDLMLRLAHSIFSKVSKDGELFVILVSVKPDGTSAKDLQQSEAGYVPLEVASSPLFGPCVAGAKMERAAAADTLLQGLKTAARVCEADGSLLFSLLVYKERKMGNDDVFLSSFLTVLAGADARVYVNGLEKPQKERGLLQYALGGPCLTVFALGLAASTEDTGMATTLGDLAKRVHGMKNGSIRTGSVRRFLAFSTKAVEQLRTWQEKASEGDRERLANRSASVVKVCADAEDLLRDPVGRCPVVYRQEE